MLNKKLSSIILSASLLAPTVAVVENFDVDCVEAATNFIDKSSLTKPSASSARTLYGIFGDVNTDGKTDIADYTLLKKYLNTDGEVKIYVRQADLNDDGQITFLDLLALKKLI